MPFEQESVLTYIYTYVCICACECVCVCASIRFGYTSVRFGVDARLFTLKERSPMTPYQNDTTAAPMPIHHLFLRRRRWYSQWLQTQGVRLTQTLWQQKPFECKALVFLVFVLPPPLFPLFSSSSSNFVGECMFVIRFPFETSQGGNVAQAGWHRRNQLGRCNVKKCSVTWRDAM